MPTVAPTKTFPFRRRFQEWRTLKGQNDQVSKRLTLLRDEMRDSIKDLGYEEEGSFYVDFPSPVEYSEGKAVHVYSRLKAERRLVPSAPTPDPDLAEELLRKKGLWMTEDQEKMLDALRLSCPNVVFEATPDVDAVSALYLKRKITEKEYESTLVEQKEQWAFVPQEIK